MAFSHPTPSAATSFLLTSPDFAAPSCTVSLISPVLLHQIIQRWLTPLGVKSHLTCSSAPSYTRMDDTTGSQSHLIFFSAPNCTVSLISPVFLHQVVHLGSFLCEPLTLQQVTHLHPEITKFSSQLGIEGLLKSHAFCYKSMSKFVALHYKITLVVYLVIMQVTVLMSVYIYFFCTWSGC